MSKKPTITWKPTDIVQISNAGDENLLLELPSGPLRLDKGWSLRVTASALEVPQVKALVDAGKIRLDERRK
jgi:hypothetical protein